MKTVAGRLGTFVPREPLLTDVNLSSLDSCAHTTLNSNHCSGVAQQPQPLEMGGSKVRDYPELHSKFEASLSYMRPRFTQKKRFHS